MSSRPVLVFSRCHNKIPQVGWLKQQKFISHSSGGWEVTDWGAGEVGFILRFLFLPCWRLPPCCVLAWPFLMCVHEEREEASSWVSLFSQGNKSHHECSILTTSSKPPKDPQLQIPIRLGLQHVNFKYDTIRSIALAFRTSHPFCIKDALIPRKQPSSLKLFLHHL